MKPKKIAPKKGKKIGTRSSEESREATRRFIKKCFSHEPWINGTAPLVQIRHPKPADSNVASVRVKLLQRSDVGLRKYGVTTERGDVGTIGWLKHAQEEAMDLCIYLEAAISSLEGKNNQPQP